MSTIVFSHGNSFPAGTYRQMLDALRARGHEVVALDKFGHDSRYPVTDSWPHLVAELASFARLHAQAHGGPVVLLGHSLGGILSLMCAARHPELARAVVMLDSPVLAGWRARAVGLVKRSPALSRRLMPSAVSRRRREHWDSREQAHAHFAQKPVFARWEAGVLDDYMRDGLQDAERGVALAFDREVESRIYETLPHGLGRLLRRHPPQCPVGFIGGTESVELRRAGSAPVRRLARAHLRMIEGTHLYPMEQPQRTAELVDDMLGDMAMAPSTGP